MLQFGLRISEALSLRPENIQSGYLCIQRLKHGEYTRSLIPPDLLVELKQRVATGGYRLFAVHRSSAFLNFKRAAVKVGIDRDRQHPHTLRHTLICWCLSAGTPVHVVSRMVGHKSINSTQQYMNCSDGTASAAALKVVGDAAIMQTTAASVPGSPSAGACGSVLTSV